jgi:hypothetical protein
LLNYKKLNKNLGLPKYNSIKYDKFCQVSVSQPGFRQQGRLLRRAANHGEAL